MIGQPALDPDPLSVNDDYDIGFRYGWTARGISSARHDYFRGACFGFFLGFVACLILNGLVPR